MIGKINHHQVINQLEKYKQISKFHKVSMGIHHAKPFNLMQNTIKDEIKFHTTLQIYCFWNRNFIFRSSSPLKDLFKKLK